MRRSMTIFFFLRTRRVYAGLIRGAAVVVWYASTLEERQVLKTEGNVTWVKRLTVCGDAVISMRTELEACMCGAVTGSGRWEWLPPNLVTPRVVKPLRLVGVYTFGE